MSSQSIYHESGLQSAVVAGRVREDQLRSISAAEESGVVGQSAPMERLRLQVQRIGPHFRVVLIVGAAGTEKEAVARYLHRLSQRATGPFIAAHAATLEDQTLQAAENPFASLVRESQAGTLFLEGVAEMPLGMQDHLLHTLRRHSPELRLIASADEDLRGMASAGRFRQELYQRLDMVEISVPPLRVRLTDIPLLAERFLERWPDLYGRRIETIAPQALEVLMHYGWPGNIAELESVLRNGILRGIGPELLAEDLPLLAEVEAAPRRETPYTGRLQEVIDRHVLRVLESCAGNKLRAAETLGISRSTLYRMLEACIPPEGSGRP